MNLRWKNFILNFATLSLLMLILFFVLGGVLRIHHSRLEQNAVQESVSRVSALIESRDFRNYKGERFEANFKNFMVFF